MFGGVNPKQMQAMMKKMGISQNEIRARRVIFETDDGDLIIEEPSVLKIMMQGQESYQVTGEAKLQESTELFKEEDVKMVMEKADVDREIAIEHLQRNDGDIAATIMELKE
jgi:nascent polypeptide-associated complex subunit alpha